MKQVVLIKQHSSIQLGHLYEHLYCTRLREFFFDKQLFEYLDFSLSGTTFNRGGLTEIAIDLHTLKAQALADQLAMQAISLDKRDISLAFSQLLAEEEQAINVSSYEAVVSSLRQLDKRPWQDIDELTSFDARDVRLSPHPMHIAKASRLPARSLILNLRLDADFATTHQELIPLFRQITRLFAYSARYLIATEEGFYMDTISFVNRSRSIYTKTVLRVADGNDEFVDIDDILRQLKEVFRYLEHVGSFEDLTRALHATSYRNNPWDAPHTHDAYSEMGVYFGSKGWKATATLENCDLLLANTTIEVAFGRQVTSARIELDPNF